MNPRETWTRAWPAVLAVSVVTAVGAPAAVASYRHARDVVASTGDAVMAPYLPLSVDGMLVAALVVIWVRRRRGQAAGKGPWAAFLFGMVVTIAANLAAVAVPSVKAYAVALFPPLAFAITLELVALVAHRAPAPVTVADLAASRNLSPAPPAAKVPASLPPLPEPAGAPPTPRVPAPVLPPAGEDREDVEREAAGTDAGNDRDDAGTVVDQQQDDRDPAAWAREEGRRDGVIPGWRLIQREFPHLTESRARTAAKDAKAPASHSHLRRVQ